MRKFKTEYPSRNVAVVRVPTQKNGDDFWVLVRSDAHHDNPKCDHALERRHLELAKERGAAIVDCGDLFCAMQGKYDKRSDKSAVRPEHQSGDYLDSLVRTAADFYLPYAHNFVVLGLGNHETAIRKNHETDLTERLAQTIRDRAKASVQAGGYTGWVRFMFSRGRQNVSRRLWYMHGYGCGGPVTKDVIQSHRQRAYVENADFIVTGHTHDSWAIPDTRLRLNDASVVEQRNFWSIKCGTYKDAYGDGHAGWEVEKGHPPKTLGAWWIRFYWHADQIREEVIRAD